MTLQNAFDLYLPQIEAELVDIVQHSEARLESYYGMMRYHLGWVDETFVAAPATGGKRLRPMLCILSCLAAGGDPQQALPCAAAVELVHNFSLVHDDIEDDSRTRRGRRAVWDLWGTAQGINVGDGLFALARLALGRLGQRGVPVSRQVAAAQVLDRACLRLCEGQFFDLSFEDRNDVNLEQYLWMIRHKTAALLAASAELGLVVACSDSERAAHFARFGESLGLAFQIQDDILGTWGDERLTGKSAATDIRDRKKTLPVVYTLSQTEDPEAAGLVAAMFSQPGSLDEKQIEAVMRLLERVRARQFSEKLAAQYYGAGLESLDRTGIEGAAQTPLRQLAASLVGRQV